MITGGKVGGGGTGGWGGGWVGSVRHGVCAPEAVRSEVRVGRVPSSARDSAHRE